MSFPTVTTVHIKNHTARAQPCYIRSGTCVDYNRREPWASRVLYKPLVKWCLKLSKSSPRLLACNDKIRTWSARFGMAVECNWDEFGQTFSHPFGPRLTKALKHKELKQKVEHPGVSIVTKPLLCPLVASCREPCHWLRDRLKESRKNQV